LFHKTSPAVFVAVVVCAVVLNGFFVIVTIIKGKVNKSRSNAFLGYFSRSFSAIKNHHLIPQKSPKTFKFRKCLAQKIENKGLLKEGLTLYTVSRTFYYQ